jgi:hypothetical protein
MPDDSVMTPARPWCRVPWRCRPTDHRTACTQVEKSLQRQSRSDNAAGDDNAFELCMLEEENERLRDEAEALLTRQFQLEDLAETHGLISYLDGALVWNKVQGGSSPSATAAPPATGSAAAGGAEEKHEPTPLTAAARGPSSSFF